MPPENWAETRRLMELEYEQSRDSIVNFDDKRYRIRGYAVTVAAALLALAGASHDSRLAIIAAGTTVFFAYSDIIYMGIQQRIIDRSVLLEAYIEAARREESPNGAGLYVFGIAGVYFDKYAWHRLPGMLRNRPQLVTFYLALLFATILAAVLL